MTTFKEKQKGDEIYQCDNCKEPIKAKEVILIPAVDNISILTPMMPFVFVNKDGVITGGRKMASKEEGDQLFTCPHCKTPHIFGFDRLS